MYNLVIMFIGSFLTVYCWLNGGWLWSIALCMTIASIVNWFDFVLSLPKPPESK